MLIRNLKLGMVGNTVSEWLDWDSDLSVCPVGFHAVTCQKWLSVDHGPVDMKELMISCWCLIENSSGMNSSYWDFNINH